MNAPKHQEQIDAWLVAREAERQADKVTHEMAPVAWHLEQILGVEADTITHTDCCYFVSKVGGEYLRRKLRGVGATISARLCKAAHEHLKNL